MLTPDAYYRPIIPLLVALICGILLGARFPGYQIECYFIIFICIFLIAANLVTKNNIQKSALLNRLHFINIFSPIILFIALGHIAIQPWIDPHFPQNHIVHFKDSDKYEITGEIASSPERYPGRQRFIVDAKNLKNNQHEVNVTGKIRVTVYGQSPDVEMGDRITFISRIKSIRNFNNPGGFNYQRYMAFQKIWVTANTQSEKIDIIKRNDDASVWAFLNGFRKRMGEFIHSHADEDTSGLLKALLLGDKNDISKKTRQSFTRAGVAHILAISGLHIGIIATFFFFIFQTVLSRFDVLLWNALVKKIAAILTLFPVLLYGAISGMSPSTQRAVIMVSVFLITFLFEREHDLINTLALAAFLILIIHPPSVFSISFQLSFITVFFIIYGLSWVNDLNWFHLDWGKLQLFKKLITFMLVSFFAFVGSLPIVMLYFNQISTVGVLANLFVIPLIGFIAVPIGLSAVFLYPVSQSLAVWCIKGSSCIIEKTIFVIRFFSDLPFAAVKTVTPSILEIVCFYVFIWALLNIKKMRIMKFVAMGVILIFIADAAYWIQERFYHDDLRVTIIDVGQGSSALLEIPGGQSLLVDGGGFSDNTYFDIGERVVAPFLWRKKIRTIDTLILSHPNSDHLNGLIYIANYFHVKQIWTNGESANTFGYKKFMDVIQEEKIDTPVFKELNRKTILNKVTLEILYPEKAFIVKREEDFWRNANNNSLIVKASFGKISILFPGDITARAEIDLASIAGLKLKSDILVSPHHGSKSSSSSTFLDTINPEYVIISSGWRNMFGFPHPQVMERYHQRGYKIFRTDLNGAITITTDGENIEFETVVKDDQYKK